MWLRTKHIPKCHTCKWSGPMEVCADVATHCGESEKCVISFLSKSTGRTLQHSGDEISSRMWRSGVWWTFTPTFQNNVFSKFVLFSSGCVTCIHIRLLYIQTYFLFGRCSVGGGGGGSVRNTAGTPVILTEYFRVFLQSLQAYAGTIP
jgi:hypothetical protein